jgi:DNA helicase-4
MAAATPTGTVTVAATETVRLSVRRRWFRRSLHDGDRRILRLRGLSNAEAAELAQALTHLSLAAAVAWRDSVTGLLDRARTEQRWVPTETIDAFLAARPAPGLRARFRTAGTEPTLTVAERAALDLLDDDLERIVAQTNEAVMSAELVDRSQFFRTIEHTPLSDEQARAVVCFDNRVQVLAAAGSGKTSVMIARAAYAVTRGFVRPERILLLAFNKAAATELQQRVDARFAGAGIDATGVRASTFHSFGLDVIGQATGEKPRLASWLAQDDGLAMVDRIVDELRDSSPAFRYRWDLYRLLFAPAPIDIENHEPDAYDRRSMEGGYRTFGDDIVKSHGERLVADFLFLHGVTYAYEKPYSYQVADATHSQYRPDFYYPDIDVWHEHWAVDRDGAPPASFRGYSDKMAWKRRVHAQYHTTLIETTWADVLWGNGLVDLGDELTRRGLTLDWDPDRTPRYQWAKPMKHEELARLVRTFMSHVKSNSWSRKDLEGRLGFDLRHLAGTRTSLFLDIYWDIHREWERRLAAERAVDFEDMLVLAAEHLEGGRVDLGYDLVMVDEFQDASRARARVVRGLLAKPGRYLMAVGDDWQSINRFAGADLSVMTDFTTWFGRGRQLALTTTFRCTQAVCDVARGFVSKNPKQFDKPMRSAHHDPGTVNVLPADDPTTALVGYLEELSASVAAGTVPGGPSGTVTVNVLGRYRFERDVMPTRLPKNLDVTFRTVHSSKGLEADYVVLPCMTTGTYGFPSTIADDPVLQLAMPEPDVYEHAEERRLFYVALTRARRAVTLITNPKRISPFVVELLQDMNVTVFRGAVDARGAATEMPVEVCPKCSKGILLVRTGRYGPFVSCSTSPRCDFKRSFTDRPAGAKHWATGASSDSHRPPGTP